MKRGMTWRLLASAGVLSGLTVALPGSAQAQVFGAWGYRTWREPIDRFYEPPVERYYGRPRVGDEADVLTPAEVRDVLAYDGFRLKGPLSRRGTTYVAEVTDRGGVRSRIIVDALDGGIIEQVALGDAVRPPRDIPVARVERDFDETSVPRVIPGGGPRKVEAPRAEPRTPRVATLPDAKTNTEAKPAPKRPDAAKPAEKKPLPSQTMRSPKDTTAAPDRPKEAAPPKSEPTTAAAQPPRAVRQVYPASGAPSAPVPEPKIELAPAVPTPQIVPNAAGVANGVPVNPLE